MAGRASRSSAPDRAPGAELACRAARTAQEQAAHFRIRHEVFVREQRLFLTGDSDRDTHDADPATVHVVGLVGGGICGTVRLYPRRAGGYWKGDRLAVLPGYRHLGLGAPLVRFAVATAAERGGREMEAYIQPGNVTFFEWLGWQRSGDLVEYVGIRHQRMVIDLTALPPAAAPAG